MGELASKILLSNVGAGTWISSDAVERGSGNAVIVEAIPSGANPSASLQVLDSAGAAAGFANTNDSAGTQTGMNGYRKALVTSILDFVKVQLVVASGSWTIRVTPIVATNQLTSTVTGALNLAQYAGTAVGPTNPLDVQTGDGKDVAIGATTDAAVTGDAAGTLSAKLRGLVIGLGAVADAAVVSDADGSLSAKLRGLVKLLAAPISLVYNWLRVQPQPCTWNLVGTSAANAAQTITQAAGGANVRNYLAGLTISWSGGAPAAGANVQVKDGATVIWDSYIGQAGATQGALDFEFTSPLRTSANAALNVTVSAAGSSVTTKVCAQGTVGP